jgi:iron-sulfur cluster assembly accessory protein
LGEALARPLVHLLTKAATELRLAVGVCFAFVAAVTATQEINYKVGNESLVKVLDGASARLTSLLKKQGRLQEGGLRIAVVGGGCSGLQYKMDLIDGPQNRDILIESNGVRVVIDPKSALFVTGSELDFSDDLQQGGFKVTNPNAVVTCSCGESFAA